ncbi:MAG: C-GCAxxG-C-C family protein [Bacillota bacterium]|jgi:C_GCAxxG_C_C family probable redox protein
MSSDAALEARNAAGNYFREGHNCAEAIFLTFQDILSPDIDRNAVKLFTGFGGGFGHAGCVCGALAASAAVLGMVKGRTSSSVDREPAYQAARKFHDRFEEKFGATCCRVLNTHPFDTPEHLKNCLKITGNTGKLLMEFLQDEKLA